jgi:hypothetical protein
MALIPEVAYQFRLARDTAESTLEQVAVNGQSLQASTLVTISALYTVPSNRILILSSMCAVGVGVGGQIPQYVQMRVRQGGGVTQLIAEQSAITVPAAAARLACNWSGQVWLHPGWQISVRAAFDAGAAVNELYGYLYGMLIPRGNSA